MTNWLAPRRSSTNCWLITRASRPPTTARSPPIPARLPNFVDSRLPPTPDSSAVSAGSGATCGGGYPAKWCERPRTTVIDNWGMYNRECVSYTAFRVAASGRYMPYWGGFGNANQWDDNARAAGIPVDGNPQAGDVAISNCRRLRPRHVCRERQRQRHDQHQPVQCRSRWPLLDQYYRTGGLVFIHF